MKKSAHQLKQENLKQAAQGFKMVGLRKNLAEMASVAGISERTVQNHRERVDEYWVEEGRDDEQAREFVRRRSIELGIEEVLGSEEPNMEELFGALLGTHLKIDTEILEKVEGLREVRTVGKHIAKVYRLVASYKHGDGVPIHSENQSVKYILQTVGGKVGWLFTRSRYYEVDRRAKRWKPTVGLREMVERSVHELLRVLPELGDVEFIYLVPHMSPQNGAKLDRSTKIIEIQIPGLRGFEVNSLFNLLMRIVKVTKTSIFVPIVHEASTDEALGRNYNVFCRLRSRERLELGYISYDMNAALQSICLQLIGASRANYPVLWDYTHDKELKRRMRLEVAEALKIDLDTVKSKLTAFANGSVSGIRSHRYYKAFQEESERLRRAVLKHVQETEPEVLARAVEQSRRELPEELDWSDTESQETLDEMRDKASVFFFVWTWYERIIRKAMLTVLTDGLEVHDAVYSKMDIDPEIVRRAIHERTGFDILVDKEKL
jgi:hypothetical protein